MSVAIITGAGGLVGGDAARLFAGRGFEVVGIDNDMRAQFFGTEASTTWQVQELAQGLSAYRHYNDDIRDTAAMEAIFARYGAAVSVIIHCAAQPSHDWAAREPLTDFTVNANGTLNLLEMTRRHCPDAVFVFVSTNKVYGDQPNALPLIELETRFELDPSHPWAEHGFDESMSVDQCLHSLFGASKVAADVLVQEYGRYFGMKTACFRGGCLTGGGHSPTQLHGFLAYLVKCAVNDTPYTIFGHKGKQVRDSIHSRDLVEAFWHFFQNPHPGSVFNIGGSRSSNCSMMEAIQIAQTLTGREMDVTYKDESRVGDHIWWVSDVRKFRNLYPEWNYKYDVGAIMEDIYGSMMNRQSNG